MPRILVFGGSIIWGAWDLEKGGWVNRLRLFFDNNNLTESMFDYSVYNIGVSGDTSSDLFRRFEIETKFRLREELIFIFGVGTNDSAWVHSKNNFWVPPNEYEQNIRKLISLARKFSSKIVFVGMLGVDEPRVDPIPWDTDKSYKNEYIKKYDTLLEEICKEEKVGYIKLFGKVPNELLEDGVHPTSKGHQKIFEVVRDFLIKNKLVN